MNFYLVFFLSSYLLVFLGLAGLFLTEELSSPYLLLAAACLALGALGEARTRKGFLPEIAANIAMLAVFVLTLFPIFVLQAPPLQELVPLSSGGRTQCDPAAPHPIFLCILSPPGHGFFRQFVGHRFGGNRLLRSSGLGRGRGNPEKQRGGYARKHRTAGAPARRVLLAGGCVGLF